MIPVLKTSIPTLRDVSALIADMDRLMIYSNYGPLHSRYKDILASIFDIDESFLGIVSSGTAGLISCLLAFLSEFSLERSEVTVAIPNWTFPATAQVALALGCRVVLIDVSDNGALLPSDIERARENFDIIIPVAPFGEFSCAYEWEEYAVQTGKKVIIDAAASFFTARALEIPVVISTHATKGFSTGEGGIVLCKDADYINKVIHTSNFGFSSSRSSDYIGINHKMSEINCAYGIAGAEAMASTERTWKNQVEYYDTLLAGSDDAKPFNSCFARTTYNLMISGAYESGIIDKIITRMIADYGIETRRWWAKPLSEQGIGKKCIRADNYQNTNTFHQRILGIPMGVHIDSSKQEQIIASLQKSLAF